MSREREPEARRTVSRTVGRTVSRIVRRTVRRTVARNALSAEGRATVRFQSLDGSALASFSPIGSPPHRRSQAPGLLTRISTDSSADL